MVRILELIRLEESNEGTFGVLKIDKRVFCFTLEPPDLLNASNVSNIPEQQYTVKPYSSEKYDKVYKVCDVPGRSNILFHKGNVVDHTHGCIILGQTIGKLRGSERAVLNSGATFYAFRKLLDLNMHHLTISKLY